MKWPLYNIAVSEPWKYKRHVGNGDRQVAMGFEWRQGQKNGKGSSAGEVGSVRKVKEAAKIELLVRVEGQGQKNGKVREGSSAGKVGSVAG